LLNGFTDALRRDGKIDWVHVRHDGFIEQAKGVTLYATRTILSGGADEISELAKTNLRELGTE
jgi:hypothetical protein